MGSQQKFQLQFGEVANVWMHVAIVVYGTEPGGGLAVFHDGVKVQEARSQKGSGYSAVLTPTTRIGHANGKVALDEFILWSKELNFSQIENLFMSY